MNSRKNALSGRSSLLHIQLNIFNYSSQKVKVF
nr:MAG TPA: hypothetical protein [Caudoviricetes sp.]